MSGTINSLIWIIQLAIVPRGRSTPDPLKHRFKSIERQAVDELRGGDVGQQSGRGVALRDRLRRQRRYNHGTSRLVARLRRALAARHRRGVVALRDLAARLGTFRRGVLTGWRIREDALAARAWPILEAHVLQHLHLGRDDVVLLGDHLADARALLATTAGAELLRLGDIVLNANAREMVGDGLSAGLLALVLRDSDFILGILFLSLRRFGGDFRLV